jgi:hypothetical protein
MKIAICVPLSKTISSRFLVDFTRLVTDIRTKMECGLYLFFDNSSPIDVSRVILIQSALDAGVDYIFCLDADNAVTFDIFKSLLDADKDFISALYFHSDHPNTPVIRQKVNGYWWPMDIVEFGKIIEVAGVGLGCSMIKADVFRNIEKPWFSYEWLNLERPTKLGEDLYFCDKVTAKGYKIYVHTGNISGHIGGVVTHQNYITALPRLKRYAEFRDRLANDLDEYFGVERKETMQRMADGIRLVKEEWLKANPKTTEEINNFYKNSTGYIYDLAQWHIMGRRDFDESMQRELLLEKSKKVLDYGCGIGDLDIMLAESGIEVVAADFDSEMLKFLEWRIKKHDIPNIRIWKIDKEDLNEKFDAIMCFDVLEHVPDSEFEATIKKLESLKGEKCRVYITASFGNAGMHPQHFSGSKEKVNLINKLKGVD